MKATINFDGFLVLQPETQIEAYALECWHDKMMKPLSETGEDLDILIEFRPEELPDI